MQSRHGLRLEDWLVWVGGDSTFGGLAIMQNRRGLRLEGEWLVWVGGTFTFGGGAKMQSRRGLGLEGSG